MIVVSGAGGNIGAELVRVLGAAGQAVRPLRHADGEDLDDPASPAPALQGADGLFLLPGYADMRRCSRPNSWTFSARRSAAG